MIAAFVIMANIAFWPSNTVALPLEGRLLPIKASYDSQEQCLDDLRKRIRDHINATGSKGVRRELSFGRMCEAVNLERHWTQEEGGVYAQQQFQALAGGVGANRVLSEFVK